MIAQTAIDAANIPGDVAARIKAFLSAAQAASADGITWAEFGELTIALLRIATDGLDFVRSLTGEQKKEIVLSAVATLFDLVADKAVRLGPAYPIWLLARPAVKALVLALASGAVEQVLVLVRKT